MQKVLISGISGFVGSALSKALLDDGFAVRGAFRGGGKLAIDSNVCVISVGDIDAATDWTPAVRGIDTVIHLAARTHVMDRTTNESLAAYRRVNVDGTQALALASRAAGVRRFIFLSSIKVNGDQSSRPYTETDTPCPEDPYGISKHEAELVLQGAAGGMETVILRPPLLYGPGVKGNFLRLMRAIDRHVPLPLASIRNQRSLLYLANLTNALVLCINHPAAAGQTYLLADDADVSSPELAQAIAAAMGKRAYLWRLQPELLRLVGAITGKQSGVRRLLGSLQIDSSKIRLDLGWRPTHTLADGLSATARWYYADLAAKMKN